jgi:hypothetical protein
VLEQLFDVLAGWYEGSETKPLRHWTDVFDVATCKLRRKHDLREKDGRETYTTGLDWDMDFVREDHLRRHLLGPGGVGGLLEQLMEKVEVRFSLVHGDLHPRNVLASRDNVWLIDFGKTGVAPTLYDFAKLEVGLRMWGLDVDPQARGLDEAAEALESLLLDILLGSESSLSALAPIAPRLGVDARQLQRIAACICTVRRRAASYMSSRPDRLDYLAVLFLVVLETLDFADRMDDRRGNFQILLALYWRLERVLTRLVGLEPYERRRAALDHRALIDAAWLEAPGAPARVRYYMEREDGRRALPLVAGLRGALQNPYHAFDCFDHTMLVLANLERVLVDPWAALVDPVAFERQVADDLRVQGIDWTALRQRGFETKRPDTAAVAECEREVRQLLRKTLDDGGALVLKWVALLHDVGKPATRCMNLGSRKEPPRPQMSGHEAYGTDLLRETLEHLFPPPSPLAGRAARLIREHAMPHNLAGEFLAEGRLDDLRRTLQTAEPSDAYHLRLLQDYLEPDRLSDLVLLLLHGYADRAACCGWKSTEDLSALAECYLVVLALGARQPWLRQQQQRRDSATRLIRQVLGEIAGEQQIEGRRRGLVQQALEQWFRTLPDAAPLDRSLVRAEALRLLQ